MAKRTIKLPDDVDAAIRTVAGEMKITPEQLAADVLFDWYRPRAATISMTTAAASASAARSLALAAWRYAIVKRWERRGRRGEAFEGQSRSTLYNWARRFSRAGLVGLIDGRMNRKPRGTSLDDPFVQEVRRRFIASPRQPHMGPSYRKALEVAARRGWETVSLKTIQRVFERAKNSAAGAMPAGATRQ